MCLSNRIMIFRVGAEIDVIFVDFSKEKPWNNSPIDSNEYEITDIIIFRQKLLKFLQSAMVKLVYKWKWLHLLVNS